MKDIAKLVAAGAIVSGLILYGGFNEGGSTPDTGVESASVSITKARDDGRSTLPADGRMTADFRTTVQSEPVSEAQAEPAKVAEKKVEPAAKVAKRPATVRFVVYFDFGSDQVSSRSRHTLAQAIEYAKSIKATRVGLAGYTDRAGPAAYNMKLSERRANMVAAALTNVDVSSDRLDVQAFGESHLAVNTPDGTAEQRNRRVEIVITA